MQTITEQQIGLIGRRLNAKKDLKEVAELYKIAEEEGLQVTDEQAQKGFKWLWNLYKTPTGANRKNSPYGLREENILETGLGSFTYDGHFNAGNAYHDFYVPLYTFNDREGFGFQYYVSGGEIHIIG